MGELPHLGDEIQRRFSRLLVSSEELDSMNEQWVLLPEDGLQGCDDADVHVKCGGRGVAGLFGLGVQTGLDVPLNMEKLGEGVDGVVPVGIEMAF